jgi:ABC-type Mn2+/Zn2+ transport system ATPase subunit
MDPGGVVSLERATVRYGELVVLREISIAVGEGQVLGVRGANGAGKTTLLRLLAGTALLLASRATGAVTTRRSSSRRRSPR